MSHGTVIEMLNLGNRKGVSSAKPTLNRSTKNDELTAGHRSGKVNNSSDFKMCLDEPQVVLDKTVVTQYFKTKKVPSNLPTLSSRQTNRSGTSYYKGLKVGENQILVNAENCIGNFRNRLSINKDLADGNMSFKEKEAILEGAMFTRNNNLFDNINEYIAQQSIEILSDHAYEDSIDYHNFVNNTSTVSIKGGSVEMECGDDILFTHGAGHSDENIETANDGLVDLECGDDILFTNDANYNENPVTTTVESDEMECGDDILFTEGAGYYNSDEDSTEENHEFSYSNEGVQTNILNDQIKHKVEMKNTKSVIIDTFERQGDEVYHCDQCHYKTFDKQELCSHVTTHHSDFSNNTDSLIICEKCGGKFETLSHLKKHQLENHDLKYFYTCKFCPSTSWYSSTLKKHIETVHSGELDKENIDEIMKNIKRTKEADKDHLNNVSLTKAAEKEHIISIEVIEKKTKKPNKKKFICYTEAKQLLKVFCSECNTIPQSTRKRILQYCSRCYNEYTYQCRKCGNFYLTYSKAWKHAKLSICDKTKIPTALPKKNQKKPGKKKFYHAFCVRCQQFFERKECNIKEICLKCKTLLEYQCGTCQKFFKFEASAQRHTQICHKKWRNNLINACLVTFALNDHNYYCKATTEPKVNEVCVVQQPVTVLSYQHQAVRKVYSGKKSQSG